MIPNTIAPGSFRCNEASCPLHDSSFPVDEQVLGVSGTVYSFRFNTLFKIRGCYSCTSKNVYVITCTRCLRQGVGECHDPVARIQGYIRVARQETQTAGCAIERHFQDAEHSVADLCVLLVDGVPGHGHDEPGVRAARVRLENIWHAAISKRLGNLTQDGTCRQLRI